MPNRLLADSERTTDGAPLGAPHAHDDRTLDRTIFHGQASFDALLRELAAGGLSPPLALPAINAVIAGTYRVEEKRGQGGVGVVFRATHLISGKQVALKWMLSACSDARARSRFVREARVAARIDHRNVLDVYDIGQDGDRGLYMAMQLRGESLGQRLLRGPLGIEETVARQVMLSQLSRRRCPAARWSHRRLRRWGLRRVWGAEDCSWLEAQRPYRLGRSPGG